MKYNIKITAILILAFILSQLIGLVFVSGSISQIEKLPSGQIVLEHTDTVVERPQTEGAESLLFVLAGVGIGTGLLLLIIKFRIYVIWKVWFFLAVFLSIAVALSVYLAIMVSLIIGAMLAALKILKPNPYVHNLTEILMYSGIVVLFVPIFDLTWIIALLAAISVYDIIAVRKTKHMVTMATFLTQSRMFAGLSIPLSKPTVSKAKPQVVSSRKGRSKEAGQQVQMAILGGGDIAFPLLFAGVVMENLIKTGLPKTESLLLTLIVTAISTLSLIFLFAIAKRGKFYPAMPFLTAGCLAGYAVLSLFFLLGLH